MATREFLGLANLGNGAAAEQFDEQLRQALENITDPNTDPKAPRTIDLHVTLRPREDRRGASVAYWVTSKLAPWRKFEAQIVIGATSQGIAAQELGTTASLFDDTGAPAAAVTGETPAEPAAPRLVAAGEKGLG